MHKLLSSATVAMAIIALTTLGCKKSSSPPLPPEEDLKISTDAASYTITAGPDFTFNVKIESAVPPGGVKIEYKVVAEIDNQNYPQGPPINTYSKISAVTINSLPRQKICLCTITVTSKSTVTNIATTSFRIGYK